MHPTFEVAVTGQHRTSYQVLVVNLGGDFLGKRSGIADTRGAAEADDVEAERVEIILQLGFFQVVLDHLAAGGERRLHPWLRIQPLGDGVAGQKPGAHQHRRVRRVGAAGDRRDYDVAVLNLESVAKITGELIGIRRGFAAVIGNRIDRGLRYVGQDHAVLRAFRPGKRRFDVAEI